MPDLPVDAFYHWIRKRSQAAIRFEVGEGELFAFAGLTTTPKAVTAPVYDRMPVIFDPYGYNLWLDPGMRGCRDSGSMGFMLDVFFEDQEPLYERNTIPRP
jgi:putative SOS response-associated peptidase YedK